MKLWQRLLIAIFDVIRPFFGFMGCVCIYPISCSNYAKHLFCFKPLYISIPLILIRIISCNPLTALLFIKLNSNKLRQNSLDTKN